MMQGGLVGTEGDVFERTAFRRLLGHLVHIIVFWLKRTIHNFIDRLGQESLIATVTRILVVDVRTVITTRVPASMLAYISELR